MKKSVIADVKLKDLESRIKRKLKGTSHVSIEYSGGFLTLGLNCGSEGERHFEAATACYNGSSYDMSYSGISSDAQRTFFSPARDSRVISDWHDKMASRPQRLDFERFSQETMYTELVMFSNKDISMREVELAIGILATRLKEKDGTYEADTGE